MNYITKFNDWVASVLPGYKTKIVTALGAVGMAAGYMQEWVTGLPLSHWLNETQLALTNAGLFTLAFWFRGLSDNK